MSDELCVAIGQMVGRLGETQNNMEIACQLCMDAAQQGARLILFPEGCLTGNAMKRSLQDTLPATGDSFSSLQKIADDQNLTICIGFCTEIQDSLNNTHAIIQPRMDVLFQYKCHRMPEEPVFLDAWPEVARTVFYVNEIKIAIMICCEYGIGRIEQELMKVSPQIILHPSAGFMEPQQVEHTNSTPTSEKFEVQCQTVVEQAASEVRKRGIAKISANPLGFDGETWWPGNSYVINAKGDVLLYMQGKNRVSEMGPSVKVTNISISKQTQGESCHAV